MNHQPITMLSRKHPKIRKADILKASTVIDEGPLYLDKNVVLLHFMGKEMSPGSQEEEKRTANCYDGNILIMRQVLKLQLARVSLIKPRPAFCETTVNPGNPMCWNPTAPFLKDVSNQICRCASPRC
ncbi:hypothetical protein NPIL_433281 [Nephila pilipes]|uniref:Uncharacterized protein n=1 Tax=Nephila pilipes TaxID=299642 RepID=A0A8X6NRM5_NEPPI|nr:hypothetical protein NPIL_433281 [Nephila pilipes]